ncbi:MAG: hypothetical protein ACRC2T_08615 [Thermoguttaceae bacterium]
MTSITSNPQFAELELPTPLSESDFEQFEKEDAMYGPAMEQLLAPAKTPEQREKLIVHYTKMMQDVIDKDQWIEATPEFWDGIKQKVRERREAKSKSEV